MTQLGRPVSGASRMKPNEWLTTIGGAKMKAERQLFACFPATGTSRSYLDLDFPGALILIFRCQSARSCLAFGLPFSFDEMSTPAIYNEILPRPQLSTGKSDGNGLKLGLTANMKVVDLGCGKGTLSNFFADYTGIDFSSWVIAQNLQTNRGKYVRRPDRLVMPPRRAL